MSLASRRLAFQLYNDRKRRGTPVKFNGVFYPMHSERVSGVNVGTQTLPYMTLGAFIASDDPRVFRVSPQYFVPNTEIMGPQGPRRMEDGTIETDVLEFHSMSYLVTAVTWDDRADDTNTICLYAYRRII